MIDHPLLKFHTGLGFMAFQRLLSIMVHQPSFFIASYAMAGVDDLSPALITDGAREVTF